MRTVGVEEELLLVDPATALPLAVASTLLGDAEPERPSGVGIQGELQEQQIEIGSRPQTSLHVLAEDLVGWRRSVDLKARQSGARVAAIATSPLPVTPITVPKARYQQMAELYGLMEHEQLVCGCHVHVSITSAGEGIAVLDRIRVWLPVLTAMFANSPYWQGRDTGYASYRSQVIARWPTAGPIEVQGSEVNYRALVDGILRSGAAIDEAMMYFDARLSATHPTIEVRVADVCRSVGSAVLLAGLARALVDIAADQWRAGEPAPLVPALLLKAAGWNAARWGLEGELVDPRDGAAKSSRRVVEALWEHVEPALSADDEAQPMHQQLTMLLESGTGARHQRSIAGARNDLQAVVTDAVAGTLDDVPSIWSERSHLPRDPAPHTPDRC